MSNIFEFILVMIGLSFACVFTIAIGGLILRAFTTTPKRKRKNDELTYEDQKVLYGEIEAAVNNLTDDELRIIRVICLMLTSSNSANDSCV